jgi:hypothetical protein
MGAGAARIEFRRASRRGSKKFSAWCASRPIAGATPPAPTTRCWRATSRARAPAELAPVFADLAKAAHAAPAAIAKNHGVRLIRRGSREIIPSPGQQALNRRVAEAMGFDFEAGRIDTTVHPFLHRDGAEGLPPDHPLQRKGFHQSRSSATMHEAGHGLYTQGLPPEHFGTPMGTYLSLGIHESQSRLWENQVGRSRDFWRQWYPRAGEEFPDRKKGKSRSRGLRRNFSRPGRSSFLARSPRRWRASLREADPSFRAQRQRHQGHHQFPGRSRRGGRHHPRHAPFREAEGQDSRHRLGGQRRGAHLCRRAAENRYSLPNTRFMLHQPSGGVGGQATDISIEAQEILKMRERLNKIFSVQTGQPVEKVERDTDRNFWMSAEEAKEYGLVGKVITTQAEF